MADLVDGFPADRGRIVRALYSPPDWDDAPKRVTTARGYIETAAFAREFSPVMILTHLEPPEAVPARDPVGACRRAQGEAALEAAVTPYFASSPAQILATIAEGSSV